MFCAARPSQLCLTPEKSFDCWTRRNRNSWKIFNQHVELRVTAPAIALHFIRVATAFFALCLPAYAETRLEIMVEDDAAPWAQADGSGAAHDMVKAAFAAVGIDVSLRTVSYARCKHMVVTARTVACFSMSPDPAIADKVALSQQPLYHPYAEYFENIAHPLQAASEGEIPRGAVIGIVTGYEYPDSVNRLAERGVILEAAGSESANMKKLASGRLDAAVVNLDELKSTDFITHKAGVSGAVKPVFRSAAFGAYIGFSTEHPQGLWAREKFNEGFAKISADGTVQRILQKWAQQPH